ncbi:hypothetical protein [Moraxella lacunata]|uniref:hypothetical protein n=1 Tax=Moraxella lacunata TaxID=477 RepID=UPI003EE01518
MMHLFFIDKIFGSMVCAVCLVKKIHTPNQSNHSRAFHDKACKCGSGVYFFDNSKRFYIQFLSCQYRRKRRTSHQ